MNSLISLQNLSGRVTALTFASDADFVTAVSLQRMAPTNGATSFYLLATESLVIDGAHPFVRILSEKVCSRRDQPPKDAVRLVPLTHTAFVCLVKVWIARETLWPVTDETMRNSTACISRYR